MPHFSDYGLGTKPKPTRKAGPVGVAPGPTPFDGQPVGPGQVLPTLPSSFADVYKKFGQGTGAISDIARAAQADPAGVAAWQKQQAKGAGGGVRTGKPVGTAPGPGLPFGPVFGPPPRMGKPVGTGQTSDPFRLAMERRKKAGAFKSNDPVTLRAKAQALRVAAL